jgi:LPS sulfotransferase NodH
MNRKELNRFNPIKDLFARQNKTFKISDVDWTKFEVDRPYLILFTPRSGSTLLSLLIGRTEISNIPYEFFNENYIRADLEAAAPQFLLYFGSVIQRHNKNGVYGFEIDARRYHWLLDLMDLDDVLRSDAGIPVIWLTRQDIVSQAYSLATAKMTKQWHVYQESRFGKFVKMTKRLLSCHFSNDGGGGGA